METISYVVQFFQHHHIRPLVSRRSKRKRKFEYFSPCSAKQNLKKIFGIALQTVSVHNYGKLFKVRDKKRYLHPEPVLCPGPSAWTARPFFFGGRGSSLLLDRKMQQKYQCSKMTRAPHHVNPFLLAPSEKKV